MKSKFLKFFCTESLSENKPFSLCDALIFAGKLLEKPLKIFSPASVEMSWGPSLTEGAGQ